MRVCAQARCGTHTRPWSGWWRLNNEIHMSMKSSGVCSPGVQSAWSCPTQMVVAPCGRGGTAKVETLEVPPEGVYQGVWARAVIDVVGPLQLLQVKGAHAPRLGWTWVWGSWSPCPGPQGCQAGRFLPVAMSLRPVGTSPAEGPGWGSVGLGGGGVEGVVAPGFDASESNVTSSSASCTVPSAVLRCYCGTVSVDGSPIAGRVANSNACRLAFWNG